jgi:hypothetical protein
LDPNIYIWGENIWIPIYKYWGKRLGSQFLNNGRKNIGIPISKYGGKIFGSQYINIGEKIGIPISK